MAVAMMALLMTITIGGVYVGTAVIARHRAQAAADLAALAAATHIADGANTACAQASALARAMHTTVARCEVEGLDVFVTVDCPVTVGRLGVGPARASAHAGPVATGG